MTMLDSEKLTAIIKFKEEFLSNKQVDPLSCTSLNQDIASSWKRSRDYGVDPNMRNVTKKICEKDYQRLQGKYQKLIDIAGSVFKTISLTMQQNKLVLSLISPSGIFLLRQGNCSTNFILQRDSEVLLSTEQTAGTSAHSLTFRFKHPFQLLGIEHYRNRFEDSVTSAAPILDNDKQVVAAVGLRQFLPLNEQKDAHKELEYSLNLISVLASIIEIQLKQQNNDLKTANTDHLLNMAFNIMDQGILTITKQGRILFGNRQSSRLLGVNQDEVSDYHIGQFLQEDSNFLQAISQERDVCMEECFLIGNIPHKYKISVHPILLNGSAERYAVKFIGAMNSSVSVSNIEDSKATFQLNNIISSGPAMRQVIDKVKRYAGTEENILIMGESGTGKELIAQAIHNLRRPQGPFIPLNCSALPRDLAISELFGYEGGSFSGAERKGRMGKIELAQGGTLFLDEIGDMPLDLQPVLLRVLQDKQIMRVGGQRYKRVDFHLICATNRNLDQLSLVNQFRRDLYYRISTLTVKIPPLCERKDDLKELCSYFLAKHGHKNRMVSRISKAAMEAIISYDWPGNVRQLENAVLGALIAARNNMIELQDLPDYVTDKSAIPIPIEDGSGPGADKYLFDLRSYRRLNQDVISKIMEKFNGNVAQAADYLGVSRSTLYRRLKTFQ